MYSYHPRGKLESISSDDYELVNTFGIDDEKWESVLSRNDSIIRSTVYFDNIEEITEDSVTYTQYFLDNNVIVIKRNGSFEFYQGFTDHLGRSTSRKGGAFLLLCITQAVLRFDYIAKRRKNIRSVVTKNHSTNEITEVQQTAYYPFGGIIADLSTGRNVQDKLYYRYLVTNQGDTLRGIIDL